MSQCTVCKRWNFENAPLNGRNIGFRSKNKISRVFLGFFSTTRKKPLNVDFENRHSLGTCPLAHCVQPSNQTLEISISLVARRAKVKKPHKNPICKNPQDWPQTKKIDARDLSGHVQKEPERLVQAFEFQKCTVKRPRYGLETD